eukprot:gene4028-4375_t
MDPRKHPAPDHIAPPPRRRPKKSSKKLSSEEETRRWISSLLPNSWKTPEAVLLERLEKLLESGFVGSSQKKLAVETHPPNLLHLIDGVPFSYVQLKDMEFRKHLPDMQAYREIKGILDAEAAEQNNPVDQAGLLEDISKAQKAMRKQVDGQGTQKDMKDFVQTL